MLKKIRFALLRAWWVVLGQKADPNALAMLAQFEEKYPNALRPRLTADMFGSIEASWGCDTERVSIEFLESGKLYIFLHATGPTGDCRPLFLHLDFAELGERVRRLPELQAVLGVGV